MQPITVFPGIIGGKACLIVNARDLHAFMDVGKVFRAWINERIQQYHFQEGQDYEVHEDLSRPVSDSAKSRPQKTKEYHLTLDMAKELAMVERTPKGREARRYFIACENELHAIKAGNALPAPADEAPPLPFPPRASETLPFHSLQPTMLAALLKMSPSLAQGYLIEHGVTPAYVNGLLTDHGIPALPATGSATTRPAVPALDYLIAEIPVRADKEDGKFWYLRRETFVALCGDFDPTATARYLRDIGCLRHQPDQLTWAAPRPLFGRRMNVFAVAKRLATMGQSNTGNGEVRHG